MSSVGVLAEGLEATDTESVIEKLIEGLELHCFANSENSSDPPEEAKALFLLLEILPLLGVPTNPSHQKTFDEIQELLKEYSQKVGVGDSPVTELLKILQEFCHHLREKDLRSIDIKMRRMSGLATVNFKMVKNLSQRIVLAKFVIFSRICHHYLEEKVDSITRLSRSAREDVTGSIKLTLKVLLDSIKSKSNSFFTGSSKTKSQDMVDEVLQSVYPTFSACQEYSQPYKARRPQGSLD